MSAENQAEGHTGSSDFVEVDGFLVIEAGDIILTDAIIRALRLADQR